MTAEEYAREVAALFVEQLPEGLEFDQYMTLGTIVQELVVIARRKGAEVQRERCAAFTEQYGVDNGWNSVHLRIATALRALPLD